MALYHTNLGTLSGGISQLPVTSRATNKCEDMVNCIPSINDGLSKRSPILETPLVQDDAGTLANISTSDEAFIYSWDRGYSINGKDKYSLIIDGEASDNIKIIRLTDGRVFSESLGTITFASDDAKRYVTSSIGRDGYSCSTIKDTTFITNRNVSPLISRQTDASLGTDTYNLSVITFNKTAPYNVQIFGSYLENAHQYITKNANTAPYIFSFEEQDYYKKYWWGSQKTSKHYRIRPVATTTTIVINNGQINATISYTLPAKSMGEFRRNYTAIGLGSPIHISDVGSLMSMDEYINTLSSKVQEALGYKYDVNIDKNLGTNGLPAITIRKKDPTLVDVTSADITISITGNAKGYGGQVAYQTVVQSNYVNAPTDVNLTLEKISPDSGYKRYGYIWVKGAGATAFSVSLVLKYKDTTGTIIAKTVNSSISTADTKSMASDLATQIPAVDANFTTTPIGSTVELLLPDGYELLDVSASDTFGNQAVIAFAQELGAIEQLPQEFPFEGAVCRINGFDQKDSNDYWVKRSGGSWVECHDPLARRIIDKNTMPHVIKKLEDETFSIEPFVWDDMEVGDEITNKIPTFVLNDVSITPTIRDIFFFKNRLGFITERSVIMSEVGNYGNFWRTTVTTLKDSDRIDGVIDSSKAVKLEYVSNLEDILVIFGDNSQFRLSPNGDLTPIKMQISKTSSYEIDTSVRPIFMNNEVFFCAKKGKYTQVMKYGLSELQAGKIVADDVSIEVPRFINGDLMSFSYSSVNNMLFISTRANPTVLYVFAYNKSGGKVIQSAWFKWKFQADIIKVIGFGNKLYMLTNYYTTAQQSDWFNIDGYVDYDGFYYSDAIFYYDHDSIPKTFKLESMDIFTDKTATFLDNQDDDYLSFVNIGEFMIGEKYKESRGDIRLKTVEIDSDNDAVFSLIVKDKERGSIRYLDDKYTKGRRPMIMGKAKNIRLYIRNRSTDGSGFNITNISVESQYNSRSRRV